MLFLPQDDTLRDNVETLIEKIVEEEGQATLGWRDVPVDNSDIADAAKEVEPVIKQIFIQRSSECDKHTAFERKLFVIRKRI